MVVCGVTDLAVVDKMMDLLVLLVLPFSVVAFVVGLVFVVLFLVVSVARGMQLGSSIKNKKS